MMIEKKNDLIKMFQNSLTYSKQIPEAIDVQKGELTNEDVAFSRPMLQHIGEQMNTSDLTTYEQFMARIGKNK